ncbi:hypothetical protein [Microcoleus sp. N9_A1]|uniref:hypothetical protein n=1 Tax=Microcoleus sp. N9_A1 TaxID=3055380 RepID=UPI002FD50A78
MLLRYAKLAGGLRLLIATAAPLVVTTVSTISIRSGLYIIGFGLGSILSVWLPVVALLVSVTGAFNSFSNNSECEDYRAEMARIEAINLQIMEAYRISYQAWSDGPYKSYLVAAQALALSAAEQSKVTCASEAESVSCIVCGGGGIQGLTCVTSTCYPRNNCESREFERLNTGLSEPFPPLYPELLSFSPSSGGCGSSDSPGMDCPAGKKVWLQVVWGSPGGKASDSKGCFLIAYSQDTYNVPVEIEYNPYLPAPFVTERALSYYLVKGDRFRGVSSTDWKNLESVSGWDKGYWIAENVDPECRGWRPGWSRKVK